MLKKCFHWRGIVKIKVNGDACERFFNVCINHDIPFWQILRETDGCTAIMYAKDFLKIKRLVKKCRVHISVIQKSGFPFFLKQHRKRKFLLLGWIWCCFFLYLLSAHIWKIEITGNQEITREQLLYYLEQNRIHTGSLKKQIDCKKIAVQIRDNFPAITWVAVKKQGTLLEIDLKENTDRIMQKKTKSEWSDSGGSNLVSPCDGKVIEIVTRKGTAAVSEGDQVKKGELLVSGSISITNDEGEVTDIYYVDADADILIETSGTYTDTFSRTEPRENYRESNKKSWYLKIGNCVFSAKRGENMPEQTDLLIEEEQICIFPDFYLPVSIGKISSRSVDTHNVLLSEESVKKKAEMRLDKFIAEKKEKGVQILKKNVRINTGMTICKCICSYQAYVTDVRRIPATHVDDYEEGTIS